MIKLKNYYKVNSPRIVYEIIDGETVMIDFETGSYFNLDLTATKILESLMTGSSVANIIFDFQQHYEIKQEIIEESIIKFIEQLHNESLVELCSDPAYTNNKASENLVLPIDFAVPVLSKYEDMQNLLLLDPIHDVASDTGWPKEASV